MIRRTITTTSTARRGSTALIAMLFLTLFTALAVGFYSTATMSVQVAGNEQRASRSQFASDSGMQFMKYHLATLGIPAKTPPAQLYDKVYEKLAAKLNNTTNMPPAARVIDLVEDGTLIRIPGGADNWIAADSGRLVLPRRDPQAAGGRDARSARLRPLRQPRTPSARRAA